MGSWPVKDAQSSGPLFAVQCSNGQAQPTRVDAWRPAIAVCCPEQHSYQQQCWRLLAGRWQHRNMTQDTKERIFTERRRQELAHRRVLVLDGELNDDNGAHLMTQLLTLAADAPDEIISLWIHSPGGSVPSVLEHLSYSRGSAAQDHQLLGGSSHRHVPVHGTVDSGAEIFGVDQHHQIEFQALGQLRRAGHGRAVTSHKSAQRNPCGQRRVMEQ